MKITLSEIIRNKFKEIKQKKKKRDFLGSLINPKVRDVSIVAEIKLASPLTGKLGDENDIGKKVKEYENGFADAISVVVDKKYFGGGLEFIRKVKNAVSLPILAKDFVIDPYQIYEMKVYGADAVLLIAKIISLKKLGQLVKLAMELNLEPVVEVQNKKELENGINTKTRIIAVNARDLKTFEVDIEKACELIRIIPKKFVSLGFSGITDRGGVRKYKNAGAKGILVGTSLMKTKNIKEFLVSLRG